MSKWKKVAALFAMLCAFAAVAAPVADARPTPKCVPGLPC
jgi:hypothetical protein